MNNSVTLGKEYSLLRGTLLPLGKEYSFSQTYAYTSHYNNLDVENLAILFKRNTISNIKL